jgi:hypothetical protein
MSSEIFIYNALVANSANVATHNTEGTGCLHTGRDSTAYNMTYSENFNIPSLNLPSPKPHWTTCIMQYQLLGVLIMSPIVTSAKNSWPAICMQGTCQQSTCWGYYIMHVKVAKPCPRTLSFIFSNLFLYYKPDFTS